MKPASFFKKHINTSLITLSCFLSSVTAHSEIAVLYDAPKFQLTDQDKKPFDSQTLTGKIWIAGFMFTSCGHECPLMARSMQRLQQQTKDLTGIHFVAITTDPKRDTSDVLSKFAKTHKADLGTWSFLTGDKAEIVRIAKDGFKLPVSLTTVTHSEKFALVDDKGKIRGYYESLDSKEMKKLESDIRSLKKL